MVNQNLRNLILMQTVKSNLFLVFFIFPLSRKLFFHFICLSLSFSGTQCITYPFLTYHPFRFLKQFFLALFDHSSAQEYQNSNVLSTYNIGIIKLVIHFNFLSNYRCYRCYYRVPNNRTLLFLFHFFLALLTFLVLGNLIVQFVSK